MDKKELKPVESTESILSSIDSERKELKDRQSEINDVIEQIKSKVLSGVTDQPKQEYSKFGAKPQSVSERMELIKAFVELQKLSVDINKTVITTYEREFKMTVDLAKYIDNKSGDSEHKQSLSPAEVVKLVKQQEKMKKDK